jgi:outer membrane protein assembly factor BamB
VFSTPAVVGDVVCVGSCAGRFYSLDRATGKPRGQHDVFSADSVRRQFHGDALLDGGLLLIGIDANEGDTAYVFAFDPRTATVQWRRPMGSGVMGDIARWNDLRYAVTVVDELVCFDALSGTPQWSYAPEGAVYDYRTSSPIVLGDRVFYADRNGTIRAFRARDGRLLWSRRQIDPLSTWMVHVNSSLMFMCGTDALVRLDPATGQERSRTVIAGGPYSGPMTVMGDSLLLLLGSTTLTAFDLQRNQVRWSLPATDEWTSSRPCIWRNMVLAGERGRLAAFRPSDGAARWTHSLEGTVRGIGTHGDTLYVGMLKGHVHALVESAESVDKHP